MQPEYDEESSVSDMDYVHSFSAPPVHDGFVPSGAPASSPHSRPRGEIPWSIGGWNKGIRMPHAPASDEFNHLYNAALSAWFDVEAGGAEEALELIQQAITVNPEVNAAHLLLAEIYAWKGDGDKAVAALFTGAHADSRDPETWKHVAETCIAKASSDHELRLKQAAYCYTRILDLDDKDHESRFKRATINQELSLYGKAMKDLNTILKDMPHNPSVLRQIAELCVETRQIPRAKKKYEECIEFNKTSGQTSQNAFSWSDVLYYVDLFARSLEYDEAIFHLKHLARWLVGRDEEQFWDIFDDDDREWDAEDTPRRETVENYNPENFPSHLYGDSLPMELRVRLGTYRLAQGEEYHEEAFSHFEWLEPEDIEQGAHVYQFPDLFLEAAYALRKAHEYEKALQYLEPLKNTNGLVDTAAWLAIAECSYLCDKREQALESYEVAKQMDSQCSEARYQLSKLYKELGDRQKAVQNAKEAADLRQYSQRTTERRQYERKDQRLAREAAEKALKEARKLPAPQRESPPEEGIPTFDFESSQTQWQIEMPTEKPSEKPTEKKDKPSRHKLNEPRSVMRTFKRKEKEKLSEEEERKARKTGVTRHYANLVNSTEAMRKCEPGAIRLWAQSASLLISDFRSNKVFYPYERHITFAGYDREARASTFRKKWQKEKVRSTPYRPRSNPELNEHDPEVPVPSIESTAPTDYMAIDFTEWLDIFLEYALIQAKHLDEKDHCYETILSAIDCTIWYHEPKALLRIYTTWFVCALILHDANTLFNVVARWFMRQYQFCTDTYRLFAALNLIYDYPSVHGGKDGQMLSATFRLGPSQKFMFRQVKAIDALLPSDYDGDGEGPVPAFMREMLGQLVKEEQEDTSRRAGGGFPGFSERQVRPTQMDVVLLTLYGHILYAAGSYPNALSYFYRAYALDGENPMVLLSISLSYVHQMFKRQNENRHLYLLEGMAFFQEYAVARLRWARKKDTEGDEMVQGDIGHVEKVVSQEIDFNRARMWQMLGMGDLALRGYEKVLEGQMGEKGDDSKDRGDGDLERENLSMEAAYAMQLIHAVNGDTETAKRITEKWLVVE